MMSVDSNTSRWRSIERHRRRSSDNFSITSSTKSNKSKRDKSLGRLGCSLSYKSSGNDSYEITSPTLKTPPALHGGRL